MRHLQVHWEPEWIFLQGFCLDPPQRGVVRDRAFWEVCTHLVVSNTGRQRPELRLHTVKLLKKEPLRINEAFSENIAKKQAYADTNNCANSVGPKIPPLAFAIDVWLDSSIAPPKAMAPGRSQ